MAVPDYQSLRLPLLQLVADKELHPLIDIANALALKFKLTEEDRREMLPSGTTATFQNRVGWART